MTPPAGAALTEMRGLLDDGFMGAERDLFSSFFNSASLPPRWLWPTFAPP